MHSISKTDQLKVSWDDITCKLIRKKCYLKSYHNDIKYHMKLNTISGIVHDIQTRRTLTEDSIL
jgi:hypothetical protein